MAGQGQGDAARTVSGREDTVIPWTRLLGLIAPHYPKAGNGRQPLGMEKMLRIYFLQQGFNLSDPQAAGVRHCSEGSLNRLGKQIYGGNRIMSDTESTLKNRPAVQLASEKIVQEAELVGFEGLRN